MRKHLPILLVMTFVVILITLLIDRQRADAAQISVSQNKKEPAKLQPKSGNRTEIFSKPGHSKSSTKTTYWPREPRPFGIATEAGGYAWTDEDGTEPSVMRMLANNDRMLTALTSENALILRRQLIYAPRNFGHLARNIFRNVEKEVTLPGFDGELFSVEIDRVVPQHIAEVSGGFTGRVRGFEDSTVVAASERDHWSIGITLPNQQLQITTREQGEWMLVEYDSAAVSDTPDCSCCPGGVHIASNTPLENPRQSPTGSAIDAVGRPIEANY